MIAQYFANSSLRNISRIAARHLSNLHSLSRRTSAKIEKPSYDIPSEGLVSKVKDMMHDVTVKRIIVRDDRGKILLSIPVTWGAAGVITTVVLAPWLAALGVIAGLVARCKVEVERESSGDIGRRNSDPFEKDNAN